MMPRMIIGGAIANFWNFVDRLNISHGTVFLVLGAIVLVGGFAIFFFITACWERIYLTGDVEPVHGPYPYEPSPYWNERRAEATSLGWQHGGDFATAKNKSIVKGVQAMFVSPDGYVLASIVSGGLSAAKLRRTTMRTRLASGQVLESSDNGGTVDLSGTIERQIFLDSPFNQLHGFHVRRIQSAGSPPVPFKTSAALQEYEQIDIEKGERWVQAGLARWADREQTSIRMTPRGALAQTLRMLKTTATT